MGGILLLFGFEICGYVLADALFKRRDGLVRLWLGLTAGLLMMMWLPSLFAYARRWGWRRCWQRLRVCFSRRTPTR